MSTRTDDWDELYAVAMVRYPEIYRALVRADHAIAHLVKAGITDLERPEMVALLQDHDILTQALRVLGRARG